MAGPEIGLGNLFGGLHLVLQFCNSSKAPSCESLRATDSSLSMAKTCALPPCPRNSVAKWTLLWRAGHYVLQPLPVLVAEGRLVLQLSKGSSASGVQSLRLASPWLHCPRKTSQCTQLQEQVSCEFDEPGCPLHGMHMRFDIIAKSFGGGVSGPSWSASQRLSFSSQSAAA